MLELVAGKAGLLQGSQKYGIAFAVEPLEDLAKILVSHGYSYNGKDLLTVGITG